MTDTIENLQGDIELAVHAMRQAGRSDIAAKLRRKEADLLQAEADVESILTMWENLQTRSTTTDGRSQ